MLRLEDDQYCFACGPRNPIGLRLSFEWDGGLLRASFVPRKEHQGYMDIVHGGIISTVLDECMAQAAISEFGVMAATVDIRVRFRQALKVGEETIAEAGVRGTRHGMFEAWSTLRRSTDGALLAEASSRLMRAL